MDKSTLIMLGFVIGIAITAISLPVFLKWPWLAVFLPWIIPALKMHLLVHVPITRVVDISVFIFAFLIVFLLVGFLTRKLVWDRYYTVLVLVHLALVAVLAVSYSWTSAPNYGFRKLEVFAVFNTVCFILGVSTVRTVSDARKMAKGFGILVLVLGIWMLILPGYMYGARWELRQTFAGTSPLNIAFVLAVGAIASLILLGRGRGRGRGRYGIVLTGVIWIVSFVATYRTGSRAMVAQIVVGTIILGLIFRGSHRLVRATAIWLVVILGTITISSYAVQKESRFFRFFQDPTYWFEKSDRPYLWAAAIKGVPQRPFLGHGVGAFAMNVLGYDEKAFPHNFFLEVLYEGGLVSFILFTLFWILVAYYLFKWRRFNCRYATPSELYTQDLWIAIFITSALASVLHWDISGQRLLWLLAGIALGATRACCQETMLKWQDDEGYYFIDAEVEGEPGISESFAIR